MPEGRAAVSPRRILVVEDDPEFRAALAEAMREAGAEVDLASDGVEALERLRVGPSPAVVLLDVVARLAGEEFVRRMRADPRFEHVPVITMSGGSTEAQGRGTVLLNKRVDLRDLRQIVVSLLEAAPG